MMTAIRSTGRVALAGLGLLVGAAAPAQAYWSGYGYSGEGPRAYYGPPPAYYVPFYRPGVLYVPPPRYNQPVDDGPEYMEPRMAPRAAPRVAQVHPKPAHRAVKRVALRPAPGPAIHAQPRSGDLPMMLPWAPKAATPVAVPAAPPPIVLPPLAVAPTPAPAPAPMERPFTPFVGD